MDLYGDSRILLEAAISEMLLRIDTIRREHKVSGSRDPIEFCKSRVKTEESMREKLMRQGLPVTTASALNKVYDAAGIRIICTFVDDVYRVAQMIRNQRDFEVIREKDYISQPKASGYRSYHIILKVPVHLMDREETVYTEIQIRTIAMDCWASLEHQLKYKHDIKNQEMIGNELKRCSDEIASTDLTLQTIRDLINEDQSEEQDTGGHDYAAYAGGR